MPARSIEAHPGRVPALAVLAIAGQAAFVVAWVVAGALQDGYSPADQTVSELAADGAANAWILWLGLLALVVSDTTAALLLRGALGRRGRLAAGLFAAAAAGVVAILLLPLDCMPNGDAVCRERVDAGDVTWRHAAHNVAAVAVQLLLIATPFAVARAIRGHPLARWALAAGAVGVLTVLAVAASEPGESGYGIAQRVTFGFVHVWVGAIALAVAAGVRAPGRVAPP